MLGPFVRVRGLSGRAPDTAGYRWKSGNRALILPIRGMTEPIASTSSLDPRPRPEHAQQQLILAAEIFLNHIGFDKGCCNAEFMWDEARDTLKMIEVNTRMAQSHVDMFFKVDGVTNHLVAIQTALPSSGRSGSVVRGASARPGL